MPIRYVPLGEGESSREFRILKLLHDQGSELVPLELKHCSIHQAPPYRALSYTWGDPFEHGEKNSRNEEMEDIIVDGECVEVSKTLASALQAMRDWHPGPTKARDFIWVDAICIDQSNLRERGRQVGLMSQIYSLADSVFAWLGPSTADSDVALRLLYDLAQDRRSDNARAAILERASNLGENDRWKALASMMDRRWWSRAWILQESVLARRLDFACGKTLAEGEEILEGFAATEDFRDKFYTLLRDKQGVMLSVHSGNVIDGLGKMRTARLDGTLFDMITCHYRSMSAEATDPRDYIYGKLGLASNGHVVKLDYAKDVDEVYRDFVFDYIKATGSIDIIHFAALPRETERIPTWVPDWKASYGPNFLLPNFSAESSTVSADVSDRSEVIAESTYDKNVLKIEVCFLDWVDGLGAGGEDGWQGRQGRRELSQSRYSNSAYGDGKSAFDALWRAMLANKDMVLGPTPPETGRILAATTTAEGLREAVSGPRFQTYYKNMKHLQFNNRSIEDWMAWAREHLPKIEFDLAQRVSAERSVVGACNFRRMFTTRAGLVAVGPHESEPDDRVCLARGSSLPLILREVGGTFTNHWVLIGAAYIHGLVGTDRLGGQSTTPDYVSVSLV